ncbi:MAG: PorV/PorQ family protein [candidate division WOR-3 bacterium]
MTRIMMFILGAVLWGYSAGLGPSATGFTFMKIGVGSRPVALGQAFTGVADDVNALFYNPAGLALDCPYELGVTACQMLQGVSYLTGGLAVPFARRFGAGLAGGFLSASDIRRDELGQELGSFVLNDLIAGPGFAVQPFRKLAVGGAGKFVYSRIDSFVAWALSFDAGVLYQPVKYVKVGASLLHLGPPRRFINYWEFPPVNLRSGVSFKLPFQNNYLLLAGDVSLYPDYGPTIGAGAELKLDLKLLGSSQNSRLFLRGGYQSGGKLGGWSGFSFGTGYETVFSPGLLLTIDAVYLSYGLLGDAQRVSLGVKFVPGSTPKS